MAHSLFQRKNHSHSDEPPTPQELIEREVRHLKKGTSVRYGNRPQKRSLWLVVLGFAGLIYLYIMDPVLHAWYKSDAIHAYLYLHNYGSGNEVNQLAGCGILSPDELAQLNLRQGSFQDYFATPKSAADHALTIANYVAQVKELHAGRYEDLDPVGRMRYALFIRTGLYLPTAWDFLDPSVAP
jgi:hypothetical protein